MVSYEYIVVLSHLYNYMTCQSSSVNFTAHHEHCGGAPVEKHCFKTFLLLG
jgi:hypothetical protein